MFVTLAAGDMVPGDLRLLTCKEPLSSRIEPDGRVLPVEKFETSDGIRLLRVAS